MARTTISSGKAAGLRPRWVYRNRALCIVNDQTVQQEIRPFIGGRVGALKDGRPVQILRHHMERGASYLDVIIDGAFATVRTNKMLKAIDKG